MFRETRGQIILFIAAVISWSQPGALFGRAETHQQIDTASSKAVAPDLEDHANYFSENRHDINPEDLKKADKLRRKTMSSIEELLKQKKNNTRRFELLLRLGELHVERHDFLRDQELQTFE